MRLNSRDLIIDPGKFEGEMFFVPYLWEEALDGYWYSSGESYFLIKVNSDLLTKLELEFPGKDITKIKSADFVLLSEDDQGFVYCDLLSETEAKIYFE